MNQQDEAALVDSFFSPGGILYPDAIDGDDGNNVDANADIPIPNLQGMFMLDGQDFGVPTTTTSTATMHLPIWSGIMHHEAVGNESVSAGLREHEERLLMHRLPSGIQNDHSRQQSSPKCTTGRQEPDSPDNHPVLMTLLSCDDREHDLHPSIIGGFANANPLYQNRGVHQIAESTQHVEHAQSERWMSLLATTFDGPQSDFPAPLPDTMMGIQRMTLITRRVLEKEEHVWHSPFLDGECFEQAYEQHGKIQAADKGNEEYWPHNNDKVKHTSFPSPCHSFPLELLNLTGSCEGSMSTTSSLSTTSSCAQSEQPKQPHDTVDEDVPDEGLPAVPSIVTTSSKRRNRTRRKHSNISTTTDACNNEKMNHSLDENNKLIVNEVGHVDNAIPVVSDKDAINDQVSVNPPPDPSPTQKIRQLSTERSAPWTDASPHPIPSAKDQSAPNKTAIDDCRHVTPTDRCETRPSQHRQPPLSKTPPRPSVTSKLNKPETGTKESFQHSSNYVKAVCKPLRKARNCAWRLWLVILKVLLTGVHLSVRASTLLYSLVSFLCLESLTELKDHPISMSCLVVFYTTPECCRILMDNVDLPHWAPHGLSTVLILSVCLPLKRLSVANAACSSSTLSSTAEMVAKHPVKEIPRLEQQASSVLLWLTRLCVTGLFVYDGISNEVGSVMRMNGMTRLLLASLVTLVRGERIMSPVSWVCWFIQVMVATLLPCCYTSEVPVVMMALSGARYVRTFGFRKVIAKRDNDLESW